MKYSTTCLAVAVITLAAGCQSPKRTFRFEYTTKISGFASSAKLARVWVPVPQSDEAQDISNVEVSGVADYEITTEPVYGNQMVYFDLAAICGHLGLASEAIGWAQASLVLAK